jgi:GxxExxY protein
MVQTFAAIPSDIEATGRQVVDSAFSVHRALGPGLLEGVYEACLAHELHSRGLSVRTQVSRPLLYRDLRVEGALRLDMLVNEHVIVELKSVEQTLPVYRAQLLSYLKLTDLRLGFLINFNVPTIRDGIERFVR